MDAETIEKESIRLVRLYKRRLRLNNWIVHVQMNNDPEWENMATTTCIDGRDEAIVLVSSKQAWTLDLLRRTIAHELVHIVMNNLWVLSHEWADTLKSKKQKLNNSQFERAIEEATNHISEVICSLRK